MLRPFRTTPAAAGFLLTTVLLLAGCASPQVAALLERPPETLPPRAELSGVPFYPQKEYQCGPAALATALVHAGIVTDPEALIPQVYLPARKGALQVEMLAAARRHDLVAYRLAPQLRDLLAEIAGGTPVVVLQNLAFNFAPRWHYAVAVGYDLTREEIILHSGTTKHLVMTLTEFERTWARGGHWAMTTLPPRRLPATATEERYVSSIVALERVAPAPAYRAYAVALEHWPDSLLARIGQGNAAYSMRYLAAAEDAYREATRRHPDAADAWNNLAQTLLELGRRDEALAAAQRAVDTGGPHLPVYQETLRAITESR